MNVSGLKKSLSILPMSTVMQLTNLTARQIRYYEQHKLVIPKRTHGNHRVYSLNDIDKLIEIKDYLNNGISISNIKKIYERKSGKNSKDHLKFSKPLSDNEVRRILREDFINASRLNYTKTSLINDPNKFLK